MEISYFVGLKIYVIGLLFLSHKNQRFLMFKKVFISWSRSYLMRVLFLSKGEQRRFLKKVLENTSCSSLKTFEQFGFGVPYSTMKNYFSEKRLLPKDLFDNFAILLN